MSEQCRNCHWWFREAGETDGYAACVFINGMKKAGDGPVKFGGSKSLKTRHDFRCKFWHEDERRKEASDAGVAY